MMHSTQTDHLARVFLARHCKTRWNLEGRIQGSNDLPLCDAGRVQAAAVAPALADYRFDTVICSPYQRAQQTAAIFAHDLRIGVHVHDGLKELNHGEWEGQRIDTLLGDSRSGYARWLQDARSMSPPGGEDMAAAQARISAAIRTVAEQYPGQRVLVITHKHIRALLRCRLRNLGLDRFGQQIDERVEPVEITSEELRRLFELYA